MAIDGATIREVSFKDPETQLTFKISMAMTDIILLKLLERVAEALEKPHG